MKVRLSKFTVSGYRNFSKSVTIDFTSVRDYKFNTECIDNGIITKIGIYGPNGSGKSNFGFALFSIVSVLTDRFISPETINPNLFLNLDSKNDKAIFTYEFIHGRNKYEFSYSKKNEDILAEESLKVNGKIIYQYNYELNKFIIISRGDIISDNLNFEYIGSNLSILRYIANNSNQKEDSPVRAIMDFAVHMLWFRTIRNNAFIGLDNSVASIDDWIIKNGLIKDFNKFLCDMCAFNVELGIGKTINGQQIIIEKHNKGNLVFEQSASSGTSAILLFYFWMKRFNEVSFLYMDEFDAYYHYSLAEKIIQKLKDYDMQAIFTTHNAALMDNSILRPDCYYFIENNQIKSFIERAAGREIREGHNLEKIYRNGGLNA